MNRILLLLALGLFVGCKKDDPKPLDGDADTDADADSDSDADTDTADADCWGTDTGAFSCVSGCTITASAGVIDTRQTVTFTVTAKRSLKAPDADVSDQVELVSSKPNILKFYDPYVGQPLKAGTVKVSTHVNSHTCEVDVSVVEALAGVGDLVVNEFLSDGTVNGDPNGDGTFDGVEDEFVEIANISDVTLDLTDVTVVESDFLFLPRHTFPSGTVLQAGQAVVVFGGGDVSNLSGSNVLFQTAINADPGTPYGLNLNDAGDTITVYAADGTTKITERAYGTADTTSTVGAATDESTVLDPDVWGSTYKAHTSATGASGDYSPGTWSTGAAFEGPDDRYP